MGKYEIPEPFVWDESFRVFYENLDAEHKGLFVGIFAVANERDNDAVLASLKAKVSAHFATEEAMMGKASYDNLADHKALHEKFVSDLAAVNTPVNEDTLIFAKDWLVNHIKDIDFQYKEKL